MQDISNDSVRALKIFLEGLPLRNDHNEPEFIANVIPTFVACLGFSENHVYLQPQLSGTRLRPDAIVADRRSGHPLLLIEAKLRRPQRRIQWEEAEAQLRTYVEAATPGLAMLFANQELRILNLDGSFRRYVYEELDDGDVYEILRRVGEASTVPKPVAREATPSNAAGYVNFANFSMDLRQFGRLVEAAENADSSNSKGDTFEDLARLIFEGLRGVQVKHRKYRTRSSEIDLILSLVSTADTFWSDFGRYALVECKNWNKPVGANSLRDFMGKLTRSSIDLGFFLSRHGVTGSNESRDALLEIHDFRQREGRYILVIAEDDLEAIGEGQDFYLAIDRKIDELRFG